MSDQFDEFDTTEALPSSDHIFASEKCIDPVNAPDGDKAPGAGDSVRNQHTVVKAPGGGDSSRGRDGG